MPKKSAITVIVILACGVLTSVFFLIRQDRVITLQTKELAKMEAQMEELTEKSNEAVIVRRASEQLEQIAYQQKDISDIQRQEAVKQRQEADIQKNIAERETEKANVAKAEALDAFSKMEEQKTIADQKREEAEEAQRKTDILARIALGRSLSSQSINMKQSGNIDLARLMAYSGWQFIVENGGDEYQSSVYDALNEISGSSEEHPGHDGYIRDICIIDGNKESLSFVSVSNSGEVFLWNEEKGHEQYSVLLKDDNYDFRTVQYVDGDKTIIAMTYDGTAVIFSGKGFKTSSVFSTGIDKILSLDISDRSLYITSKDGIFKWLNDSNQTQPFYHSSQITASHISKAGIYIAERNGEIRQMDYSAKIIYSDQIGAGNYITYITDQEDGRMAFGLNNGEVVLYGEDGEQERLLGHISSVNSILWGKGGLVTASSDGTIRFWNYADHAAGSLLIYKSTSWIFTAALIDGGTAVISGGASSTLNTNVIVPEMMAEKIQSSLVREYTESEWNYYIGEVSPYRNYMKK